MLSSILIPAAVVAGIGLVAGAGLAIASVLMAVPKDERAEAVLEVLPGANCGACGYSGCSGYAAALASGEAKNGLCAPGGDKAAQEVAAVLGISAEGVERKTAVVHCLGTYDNTSDKIEYQGVNSCAAAMQ
ncbi:MAG: RnfABCDGE type electron transport complex subunit B, partial [Clostridia bacterium]|nr:RnfABCDGE type electron transport complex subunit B [Clostridia bacterium]